MTTKKSTADIAAMFGKLSRTATDDAIKNMVDLIRPHLVEMQQELLKHGRAAYVLDPSSAARPPLKPITPPSAAEMITLAVGAALSVWAGTTTDDSFTLNDGSRCTWLISLMVTLPIDKSYATRNARVGLVRSDFIGRKTIVIPCATRDRERKMWEHITMPDNVPPEHWYEGIVKDMLMSCLEDSPLT